MDIKKALYSLGVFNETIAKDRIYRRFAILFLLGGLITIVSYIVAGIPPTETLQTTFWMSILGMLEKALREMKQ